MTNVISTVSQQWASRPDDQRFLSLDDLARKVNTRRAASHVHGMALEHLAVRPTADGAMVLGTPEGGPIGKLTHWTFGQLCTRAKAPAGFLRELPADLAAANLQWKLEQASEHEDGKVLVYGDTVGAITSPTYGRIWDSDIVKAVQKFIDPTVWKVPGASYASKDPKRATTLYASDRDVFLFLVDETRPIEVDGTQLYRGFYIQNSETYASSFVMATMLYEYVCDNRNIWGPRDFREIRIRHTSGGPTRYLNQAVPQLNAYAQSSARPIEATVRAATSKEIGKDRKSVQEWLRARGFSLKLAGEAYDSAEASGRNPRTIWGAAWGITDASHSIAHTDARMDIERKAGALLDLVTEDGLQMAA